MIITVFPRSRQLDPVFFEPKKNVTEVLTAVQIGLIIFVKKTKEVRCNVESNSEKRGQRP